MSGRNSFQRPMPATWWSKRPGYRFYMVREATSVLVLLFAIELWWALRALAQGADSWHGFIDGLHSPAMIVLNWLILAAVLLHMVTWFRMTPKTMNLKVAGRRISDRQIELGHYVACGLVSLLILLIALGGLL